MKSEELFVRYRANRELVKALQNAGRSTADFELVEADLTRAEGWDTAVEGCDFVLHVASPFILGVPKHEDDLIVPCRLRCSICCVRSHQSRCQTGRADLSGASITDTHDGKTHFTEADWTDTEHPKTSAYYKSKTLAERRAWDLIEAQTGETNTELTVINPTVVVGPSLTQDIGTSNEFIRQIVAGKVPAAANLHFGFVDVRDVAAAHITAMTHENAAGERFIVNAKEMWLLELTTLLNKAGFKKAPTKGMPNWLVKVFGLVDPATKQISQLLDSERLLPRTRLNPY